MNQLPIKFRGFRYRTKSVPYQLVDSITNRTCVVAVEDNKMMIIIWVHIGWWACWLIVAGWDYLRVLRDHWRESYFTIANKLLSCCSLEGQLCDFFYIHLTWDVVFLYLLPPSNDYYAHPDSIVLSKRDLQLDRLKYLLYLLSPKILLFSSFYLVP